MKIRFTHDPAGTSCAIEEDIAPGCGPETAKVLSVGRANLGRGEHQISRPVGRKVSFARAVRSLFTRKGKKDDAGALRRATLWYQLALEAPKTFCDGPECIGNSFHRKINLVLNTIDPDDADRYVNAANNYINNRLNPVRLPA